MEQTPTGGATATAEADEARREQAAQVLTPQQQQQIATLTPEQKAAAIAEREKQIESDYGLSAAEYAVLRTTVCKDAPREHASFFMLFCRRRRLDPFSRHVYLMETTGKENVKDQQWQIVSGIDGLRTIAARNELYRGQSEPEWKYAQNEDGSISTFDKSESKWGEIAGKRRVTECRVVVYRAIKTLADRGQEGRELWLPFVGIARFDEFVQKTREGKIKGNWEKQPEHQLRVRAEAMALRMAFPEDVGSIYTQEEMEDVRERALSEATGAVAAAVAQTMAQAHEADRVPEDAEIDAIAEQLRWTKGMTTAQLVRFGNDKAQLLDHMRKQLEVHEQSGQSKARRGEFDQKAVLDEPAREEDDAPEAIVLMSDDTKKRLFALLGELEPPVKSRDERLAFANEQCGLKREDGQGHDGEALTSYGQLTEPQATGMCDYLERLLSNRPQCVADTCEACGVKKGKRHKKDCPLPVGSVDPQGGRLL